MSKALHAVLQVLGAVVQYASIATTVVPDKYKPLVAAVVGLAQAGLALSQHKS